MLLVSGVAIGVMAQFGDLSASMVETPIWDKRLQQRSSRTWWFSGSRRQYSVCDRNNIYNQSIVLIALLVCR
jgi:hypothetical protein